MINIKAVELSKSIVRTGETFIIRVAATETFATWNNINLATWSNLGIKTWDKARNTILESPLGSWNRLNINTWDDIKNKRWEE